jgi:Phage integrase family
MFDDWAPRDSDARDGDDGIRDREEEWLVLGRGPGSVALRDDTVEHDTRDREEDWRDDRDRDARDRADERGGVDPCDVFMRDLDLPRGRERELVHDRDRDYTLNGSDTRTLSTVGAFRVVPERDLRDPRDAAFDVREKDLRRLEHEGLIQRLPLDGHDRAIALTDRGRGQERFRETNLHWHDLRHEYASRLVERGVPLAQVRDLLGHASILTTER